MCDLEVRPFDFGELPEDVRAFRTFSWKVLILAVGSSCSSALLTPHTLNILIIVKGGENSSASSPVPLLGLLNSAK